MVAPEREARRIIAEVSYETLLTLIQTLPRLPDAVTALDTVRGTPRSATFAELQLLRWFLAFDAGRIVGIAATHDRFDWPTLCDIRELVHLAGSKRAVDELLRDAIARAFADGRPLYGEFASGNAAAIRHAARRGATIDRVVMAIGGPR